MGTLVLIIVKTVIDIFIMMVDQVEPVVLLVEPVELAETAA